MFEDQVNPVILVNRENSIVSFSQSIKSLLVNIKVGAPWPEVEEDILKSGGTYKLINYDLTDGLKIYTLLSLDEQIERTTGGHILGMINAIPEAVIVIQDMHIVLANTRAKALLEDIDGKHIKELLADTAQIGMNRVEEVIATGIPSKPFDYKIQKKDGTLMYAEVSSNVIMFNGRPAVFSVARDVTYKRYELNEAARVQQLVMTSKVPHVKNIEIENISVPSKTVSGDFYFYEKVSANKIVGILGDVRGKGISAALKISALEMLFRESVAKRETLESIIARMNKKVMTYFDDVYVAALLFSVDTTTKEVKVAGAGINEFISIDLSGELVAHLVKGPFLGMFDNLQFDVKTFKGDLKRLILYTDGFEENVIKDNITCDILSNLSLDDISKEVSGLLKEEVKKPQGLLDDCTMILCDFNFVGTIKEYVLRGLSDYKVHIPKILEDINVPSKAFEIRLILMELITNAFKYGNKRDPGLPIKVSIKTSGEVLSIEVTDMNLTPKDFTIKTVIKDDELMEESGRGLFIISQFARNITIRERSIVVKVKLL